MNLASYKLGKHKRLATIGYLVVCLFWCLTSTKLSAQTFDDGYKQYALGKFAVAEKLFVGALKKPTSTPVKAKILKYLGIVQYMQKKTSLAQTSFKYALKFDPRTIVRGDEVLDESVVTFFNNIRASVGTNPITQNRGTNTSSKPRAQHTPKFGQPTKRTNLRVNTNAENATVLIDGILAGNAGTLIEADPGIIEIQIDAPGYISKKAKVRVIGQRENSITINLNKPKPKPKPRQKPTIVAGGEKSRSNRKSNDSQYLPDPGTDELFGDTDVDAPPDGSIAGRNLQQEFALDSATAPYQAPPAPQGQMPQQVPQMQQIPQGTPYGAPQQGYYTQPQPYPAYPYGYGYQQPVYPYPTQPYAPGYAPAPYSQPQYQAPYAAPYGGAAQSPYTPATPPPAISSDPVMPAVPGGSPANYYDSQDTKEDFLPPIKDSPRTKSAPKKKSSYGDLKSPARPSKARTIRKKKSRSRSSTKNGSTRGGNFFVAILPFGIGQFQNESYILGSAFLGAEVFASYWFYSNKVDADEAASTANANLNEPCGSTESEEECSTRKGNYEAEAEAYVSEKRAAQYQGLYGFIGLWVAGAIEAVWNMPEPKKPSTKRRLSLIEEDIELATQKYAVIEEEGEDDEQENTEMNIIEKVEFQTWQPRVSFGLFAPNPDIDDREQFKKLHNFTPGVMVEWKF